MITPYKDKAKNKSELQNLQCQNFSGGIRSFYLKNSSTKYYLKYCFFAAVCQWQTTFSKLYILRIIVCS